MTDTQDYVYAIGHPHGYVKIGKSNDVARRLSDHQISSPYELWIIAQLPVDEATVVEDELHQRFEDAHVRGEWFKLDYDDYDVLIDYIKMADSTREFDSVEEYRVYKRRQQRVVF